MLWYYIFAVVHSTYNMAGVSQAEVSLYENDV